MVVAGLTKISKFGKSSTSSLYRWKIHLVDVKMLVNSSTGVHGSKSIKGERVILKNYQIWRIVPFLSLLLFIGIIV